MLPVKYSGKPSQERWKLHESEHKFASFDTSVEGGRFFTNMYGLNEYLIELRYEGSSLKLYKELSSSIFQSLWVSESGMRDTLPDLHFVQYIKA